MRNSCVNVLETIESAKRDVMLDLRREMREAAVNYQLARILGKSRDTQRYYLATTAGLTLCYNQIRAIRADDRRFRPISLRTVLRLALRGE